MNKTITKEREIIMKILIAGLVALNVLLVYSLLTIRYNEQTDKLPCSSSINADCQNYRPNE